MTQRTRYVLWTVAFFVPATRVSTHGSPEPTAPVTVGESPQIGLNAVSTRSDMPTPGAGTPDARRYEMAPLSPSGTVNTPSSDVHGFPADPRHEKWAEDFGANGNCSSDDQPAIQSGVDWLAEHGGGYLRLRSACYEIRTTVAMRSGVYLRGQGIQHTVLRPAFTTGPAVSFAGRDQANRVEFAGLEDLRIDGRQITRAPLAHGVYLIHATANITFKSVMVRMVGGWGFFFDGDVFEVRGWNVYIASPQSGGILMKGVGARSGSAPWTNDNNFTDLYFVSNRPGTRWISLLGQCESNRFVNVSDQSGRVPNADALVYVQGRWNTFARWRTFDSTFDGVPLGYFWLDGATAVRNSFFDTQAYAGAGFPLIRLTQGAAGNQFVATDRTGTPEAVYYADASSASNTIDFKDGSYSAVRKNERMIGSAEIRTYQLLGESEKTTYALMQHLGSWDQSDQSSGEYRVGKYLLGFNETFDRRDRGYPVALRTDTADHRTFRFENVHTGNAHQHPTSLRGVLGVVADDNLAFHAGGRVVEEGRAILTGVDASRSYYGAPVYVDPATSAATLSAPDVGHAIVVGWVTKTTNPAEAYIRANFLSEYARRARLGMQRFTADPRVGEMSNEELAVGIVASIGKIYYKSGGNIYVFNATATIRP